MGTSLMLNILNVICRHEEKQSTRTKEESRRYYIQQKKKLNNHTVYLLSKYTSTTPFHY